MGETDTDKTKNINQTKSPKQKICPNCGEHLTPEQDVCPVCGLNYVAYMKAKSNPKAELAKLYELVESYDGWSTPEEKKERRREERRKEKEERSKKTDTIFLVTLIAFIPMILSVFGLIPEASFWIKIVGWFIIGGGGGIGVIILSILTIGGIGHGIIVLVDKNKEIPEVTKAKQRIKEIEATGVTYNYQRPKPKEEVKSEPILKKEEPSVGEYKGEVRFEGKNNKRKKEIERKIHFVLSITLPILYILFTAFMLKKMDSKLGVFTNSLTGKIELFNWFYMCWEDISILLILISMVMNIGAMIWSYIKTDVFKIGVSLSTCAFVAVISFLVLGMVYGGGSIREEAFIRWYWLYVILEVILALTLFGYRENVIDAKNNPQS